MGRITIFSITTCPFCARAKAALSKRSIPYCDINIEAHPSRRSDMLSLTDRLTVPQIFLNDEHVGGGDDLLALLERWDEDIAHGDGSTDGTPYDRYVRLVESGPDPTDARLAIPAADDAAPTVQFDLTASRTGETFDVGDSRSYASLEVTRLLVQKMPREDLQYYGWVYRDCFKGSSGVSASYACVTILQRSVRCWGTQLVLTIAY